ncbi:hypothetical protein M422DRAFT_777994 [Sphaerobolus stellatus SS14]|uniref:DUF6534 domain-containing protein n=1 Tax=Sphaerobolus stellatus (strain SS14) TaxID=990650 RepID=A0A0C9W5U3_SPHS4|nr:hypothetical protein M422DRAFT_777994 [Sphaerobolus stellatus SS14]
MSTDPLVQTFLDAVAGGGQSFLIALPVMAMLWAIGIAQTCRYYKTYPGDTLLLKYFVGICLILNTLIFAGFSRTTYFWAIYCRLPAHYLALPSIIKTPSLSMACYTTSVMTAVVQCFYALRVWVLSGRNIFIAFPLFFTILAAAATGIAVQVRLDIAGSLLEIYDHFSEILQTVSFICSSICDIMICSSLAFFLNRRKKEAVKSTQGAILQLVIYSVNIGLVTTLTTVLDLVTWKTIAQDKFVWIIFYIWLGGIYFNSLLVSLNARASIRSRLRGTIPTTTLPNSTIAFDMDGPLGVNNCDTMELTSFNRNRNNV